MTWLQKNACAQGQHARSGRNFAWRNVLEPTPLLTRMECSAQNSWNLRTRPLRLVILEQCGENALEGLLRVYSTRMRIPCILTDTSPLVLIQVVAYFWKKGYNIAELHLNTLWGKWNKLFQMTLVQVGWSMQGSWTLRTNNHMWRNPAWHSF